MNSEEVSLYDVYGMASKAEGKYVGIPVYDANNGLIGHTTGYSAIMHTACPTYLSSLGSIQIQLGEKKDWIRGHGKFIDNRIVCDDYDYKY